MPEKITEWHKAVKIKMIERGLTYADIAQKTGMARSYVSSVVNGRVYSKPAVKKISSLLGIPDGDFDVRVKFIPRKVQ